MNWYLKKLLMGNWVCLFEGNCRGEIGTRTACVRETCSAHYTIFFTLQRTQKKKNNIVKFVWNNGRAWILILY